MTVLRTARLVLRPKAPADLDAIHAIASRWEVIRWTASWPWPPDRAFTEERLARAQPDAGLIASVVRDGEVIGMASVHRGGLGYMLAPSAWGQGYATEACAALLDHAFATTDWPEVTAGVFDGNEVSIRVLYKLGFTPTGRSPVHSRAAGRELEGTDFSLSRKNWSARAR